VGSIDQVLVCRSRYRGTASKKAISHEPSTSQSVAKNNTNEATALRSRQEFQRSQLTELASTDFGSWAKESFEIAVKIANRNGQPIGIPKAGAMDCAMVAAAPVLPAGYVVNASRITDRRIMLAGYRLAELITRIVEN